MSADTETINFGLHFASPCGQILEYVKLLNGDKTQIQAGNQLTSNQVLAETNQAQLQQLTPVIPQPIHPLLSETKEEIFEDDPTEPPKEGGWLSKKEAGKLGYSRAKRQYNPYQHAFS